MPERCVPVNKCGTHSPLWLAGKHPRRRDGIVKRKVCGHWKKRCCAFRSTPIRVKKCRGNYYVYQFTKPSSCYLAYCAGTSKTGTTLQLLLPVVHCKCLQLTFPTRSFQDVNTLVCGRCRRNQSCVSRDKINWRCKRKKRCKQLRTSPFKQQQQQQKIAIEISLQLLRNNPPL